MPAACAAPESPRRAATRVRHHVLQDALLSERRLMMPCNKVICEVTAGLSAGERSDRGGSDIGHKALSQGTTTSLRSMDVQGKAQATRGKGGLIVVSGSKPVALPRGNIVVPAAISGAGERATREAYSNSSLRRIRNKNTRIAYGWQAGSSRGGKFGSITDPTSGRRSCSPRSRPRQRKRPS